MTIRNMITYEGYTYYGYGDYLLICASVSSSSTTEHRITLAVAAEHMQDGSVHGYTCSDHGLRMYVTQKREVIDYMKRVGWKEDWICHQL